MFHDVYHLGILNSVHGVITCGNNYLVRRFKITFRNVGIHMFVNEGGQLHLVRGTKGQWGSKEKDGYRADSEIESCVK